jgi:hypothetical protein
MINFERRMAGLPLSSAPMLMVVVDTEEEFDWSAPFYRDAHGIRALDDLQAMRPLFEQFAIRPVYAVDYPVADSPHGAAWLRADIDAGRAVLGAQLHTWVTPPFDEVLDPVNSYQGNLERPVERAKLEALTARVAETFGARPVIHKAGRYGIGQHTPDLICALGYDIDLSVCARFDDSRAGGPDHTAYSADPFWFGPGGRLLELPTTAGYCGIMAPLGERLHGLVAAPAMERAKVKAVLSRLRVLERIRLSPEGYSLSDLERLTRRLMGEGTRVFTFSFHSPSLRPGCTPYVRDGDDLAAFLKRCSDYFSFFRDEMGGRFVTPFQVREALGAAPTASNPRGA